MEDGETTEEVVVVPVSNSDGVGDEQMFPHSPRQCDSEEESPHESLRKTKASIENAVAEILALKKHAEPKPLLTLRLRELLTQTFLHFVTLRQANRSILLEEEHARTETERAKAPLELTTQQLQNLMYEKSHYVKAIKACNDFKSKYPDIEVVSEGEFFRDAPQDMKDSVLCSHSEHNLVLKRLNFELFQRKELCKLHDKLEQKKKTLLETIANRKKFLSSLPSHLKSLKKASLPVQNQLGVQHTKKLKRHHSAELLPPPLYVIYSQLLAQKEAFGESIDVEIVGSVKDAQNFAHIQAHKDTDIMAAAGPSSREVFLELRRKRLEEEKRRTSESSHRSGTESDAQRGDLLPPPAEKKKSKHKDRPSKPSTPQPPSPKKTRGSVSNESMPDSFVALFDSKLKINEGIEVSLSAEEADIVSTLHPKTVLYMLNEFQARAIVMGRHLETVLSKLPDANKLGAEIKTLQSELAEANRQTHEMSLQLENVRNERSQLLSECNALKVHCRDLEKKGEKSQAALELIEEELAASKKEYKEALGRIYQLKGYVMSQHEEGFYKGLRQASHFYNINAEDERFDIDKDMHDDTFMAIQDIPLATFAHNLDERERPATPPYA